MQIALSIITALVLAALAVVMLLRPRGSLDDPKASARDARLKKLARVLLPIALVLVAIGYFTRER